MATYRWIGGAGNFDAASSWQVLQNGVFVDATTPPSSSDLAEIETAATISGAGTAQELAFDALTTISGTDDIGTFAVIADATAADIVVATQWSDTGGLIIGEVAAGTLTILPGATAEIGGSLALGNDAGSSGTVVIGAGGTLAVAGASDLLGDLAGAIGQATVSGAGALWSVGQLTVGASGTGAIAVTDGGSLATSGEYNAIGVLGGGSGTVVVDGANSQWSSEDEIDVGCAGNGTLIISDDATVSSEDITGVGLTGGGTGTLFIESGGVLTSSGATTAVGQGVGGAGSVIITGPNSAWRMSSNLAIGLSETANVFIGAGSTLSSAGTSEVVGNAQGVIGNVTISGTGALWTMPGDLIAGLHGTGDISINDGGSLYTGGWYNGIGVSTDGSGTVVVDGPGSEWTSQWQIDVGCTGDGTLIISDEATVISDDITGVGLTGGGTGTLLIETGGQLSSAGANAVIGDATGGSGAVTITGPDATWRMTSNLVVGAPESGRILVEDGATLSTGGTLAMLGVLAGGGGTVTLDDAGSNWQVAGQLVVGGAGTGTVAVAAGAWLSAATVDISGTGSLDLAGGTLAVSTVTDLGAGALLTGAGTLVTSIFNFGTIVATGALSFEGQVQGGGVFDIGTGGDAIFDSPVLPGTTIGLLGATGRLDLADPAGFQGTVAGFNGADTIFAAGADSIRFAGGSLITLLGSHGDPIGTIQLAGSYAPGSFVDNDGSITDPAFACFVAGTHIATPGGEIAVEQLRIGDLVLTGAGAAHPAAAVKWLGYRRVDFRRQPVSAAVWPVRISADAFGPGQPHRDLWLSPEHAVFAEGILIPVKRLVNGTTVTRERRDDVTYWHIELGRHDVILAEGLPCESYLDTGNRSAFVNGEVVQLRPDFEPHEYCEAIWEAAACAPLRITGKAVGRVDALLRRRAGRLGHAPARRAVRKPAQRDRTTANPARLLQPTWYLANNPDVAAAGMDAATHYNGWGQREGRLPCPEIELHRALGLIDPGIVVFTMSDVIAAGVDSVEHFCTTGWRERRRPNAYFETGWYLDTYDVPAGMNPLLHYVLFGENQGLRPSRHFDPAWYRRRYRLEPPISALAHFLKHRRAQRFSPLPTFDLDAYRKEHAATLLPDRDPYAHYLAIGRFVAAEAYQADRAAA